MLGRLQEHGFGVWLADRGKAHDILNGIEHAYLSGIHSITLFTVVSGLIECAITQGVGLDIHQTRSVLLVAVQPLQTLTAPTFGPSAMNVCRTLPK